MKAIDTDTTDTSNALQAALDYAQRGWSVLPLHTPRNGGCSCGKADCSSAGKHPRLQNGLKAATSDESFIRQWWAKWAEANVGVVTGAVSGIVVVDVDDREGESGSASLASLEQEHGALPATLTCETGKGRHHYFRHPGVTVKNSASKVGLGLDLRADGGYVVAAPSLHQNGKRYRWIDPSSEISALPSWLLSMVRNHKGTDFAPGTALVPIGSRNDALASYGGRLRAHGMDQHGIESALLDRNARGCAVPLATEEVLRVAASIAKYEKGTHRPNLPWFQFFVRDWFSTRVVRIGKDYQLGWYVQLMVESWEYGGFLPNDPELLWQLAGATSRKAFEKNGGNLLVLGEFEPVQLDDGATVLRHRWLADHYLQQVERYEQKCSAAAKSAAKRKGQQTDALPEESFV